ncbi:hypothetical protein MYMAC_007199 [Corallococcus macrosporus DSM 14697]|uniref:Uncharacterized protein n=1 Tax=Corallococcus macrosporus DSM 14697 TaxID=1189310 RepID=A0A286SGQ4_9BACT|nr:hypothetical protein MYMAC_007199 [Corallococcus macrosporus DSM 14697]
MRCSVGLGHGVSAFVGEDAWRLARRRLDGRVRSSFSGVCDELAGDDAHRLEALAGEGMESCSVSGLVPSDSEARLESGASAQVHAVSQGSQVGARGADGAPAWSLCWPASGHDEARAVGCLGLVWRSRHEAARLSARRGPRLKVFADGFGVRAESPSHAGAFVRGPLLLAASPSSSEALLPCALDAEENPRVGRGLLATRSPGSHRYRLGPVGHGVHPRRRFARRRFIGTDERVVNAVAGPRHFDGCGGEPRSMWSGAGEGEKSSGTGSRRATACAV